MVTAKSNFQADILSLVTIISQNHHLESAWLTALGHIEDLAARQILGNISASTPSLFYDEIKKHASDEKRHRDLLLSVRPHQEATTPHEQKLRQRFLNLVESFAVGYFSNPLLVTAKSRFHAYVHGALTIEQFPFQLYSAYARTTKLDSVRSVLKNVLADENDHLRLGKKMLSSLPEKEKLSLQRLHQIEKKMCHTMVLRMLNVAKNYLENLKSNFSKVTKKDTRHEQQRQRHSLSWPAWQKLSDALSENIPATCFWIYAWGYHEHRLAHLPLDLPTQKKHSEWAQLLQQTIVLRRRQYRQIKTYKNLELLMIQLLKNYEEDFLNQIKEHFLNHQDMYAYLALGFAIRTLDHYQDLKNNTHSLDVAYILDVLVKEKLTYASHLFSHLKTKNIFQEKIMILMKTAEKQAFKKTAQHALQGLQNLPTATTWGATL